MRKHMILRIMCVLLAALMLMPLAACGKKPSEGQSTTSAAPDAEATTTPGGAECFDQAHLLNRLGLDHDDAATMLTRIIVGLVGGQQRLAKAVFTRQHIDDQTRIRAVGHAVLRNGIENLGHIEIARRHALHGRVQTPCGMRQNGTAADLNGDGVLTSTDVVILRRYIAGGYGIELPNNVT